MSYDAPCTDWNGRIDRPGGYGVLHVEGKRWYAHRWVFYKAHGYLPPVVRHRCDRPPCVNVAHLQPGTQADNNRDTIDRGRARRAQGRANGRAKLTSEQVAEIRTRYPHESGPALAAEFGVHHTWIYRIVRDEVRKVA
jgi:hypothetical protein